MKRLGRDWVRLLCLLGVLVFLGRRSADAQGPYRPVSSDDVVAMKFNHYFTLDMTHHEADFGWSFGQNEFVIKKGKRAIPADLCERLLPKGTTAEEIRGTWSVKGGHIFLTDIKYGDKDGNKDVNLAIYRTAPTVIRIGEPQYVFALVLPLGAGDTKVEKASRPSKENSKPVRAEGVDFEVAAEGVWKRPAQVYEKFEPGIDLRISNRTDKALTFELADTLRVSLKAADGRELVMSAIPKRHFPKPFNVAAGNSETIALPIEFVYTRIDDVCLGAAASHAPGTNWLSNDIPPGEYQLCLSFENDDKGDDAWVGKMRTGTVDIVVKAAK